MLPLNSKKTLNDVTSDFINGQFPRRANFCGKAKNLGTVQCSTKSSFALLRLEKEVKLLTKYFSTVDYCKSEIDMKSISRVNKK